MKTDKEKAPCVGAHNGDLRNNNYSNNIAENSPNVKRYSTEAYHASRFAAYAYDLIEATEDLNKIREPLMGLIEIADEKAKALSFELDKNELAVMGVVGHG